MDNSSLLLRAEWVCPVGLPPLRHGWVRVEGDVVTAVGQGADAPAAAREVSLGSAAILPGLVNAHAHLELSWLRGRVPPGGDFLTWVGHLMRARTSFESADDPVAMAAVREAVDEMRTTGTVAVGDISNALVTPAVLAEMWMPGVVFHELTGFAMATDERR